MKIALISANRETLPDPVVPIGPLYVLANLPAQHHAVLWDLCFEADPFVALDEGIADFQPDVVGVSIRNLQNSEYSESETNIRYYAQLIAHLRQLTRATIVVGGSGFSVSPRTLMQRLRPDYGIRGEGEHAFASLVDALDRRASTDHIPGLLRAVGDEVTEIPRTKGIQNLDQLRRPARKELCVDYHLRTGIDAIQTKRGCALDCSYCTYPLIEGRTVRLRDPSCVVDEMQSAAAANPTIAHFFVVDAVFNIPPRHAKAVCREMIDRRQHLPWTCYINPIGFDLELAEALVAAGCAGIEIGSDSGVDSVLHALRKGFDTAKIRAVREICHEVGLPDCHTFMIGTPGESLEDVEQTLRFFAELDPHAAVAMIWSEDREHEPSSAGLERQAIVDLVAAYAKKQQRWSVPALGWNYGNRLFNALRKQGLKGPLWQHWQR